MAKTNIVLIRMPDNIRSDVEVIRQHIAETTKQAVTTSDAIRTAVATMAAEIQQRKTKEQDSE